ncbi:MAG: cytochrome b/b6 domain-containing protein [Candidatus Sumerlaeota bacterium]|nr:cytochrome b/b6 domain-containing protein [Candidatus Sumerlaeota bacterium]
MNPDPNESRYVMRFSLEFRVQHIVLFVSTLALIVTGIPMWCIGRPEYTFWSQAARPFYGGIDAIRQVHRWAAVGLIVVSIYHIYYILLTREGRREFWELLPKPKDFVDVARNSFYFLHLRKAPPRFGRYSYFEKFDYWAVYWGCVIMIGSGLTLWFDRYALTHISWFPYELSRLIHSDEAILAALALLIWHFYNVHFNPSVFPGAMTWWHGRITREEMQEKHPLEQRR